MMQDEQLKSAVAQYGAMHWKKISEHVPGRSDVQCLHRWQKVLNPKLLKGPWTKDVRYFNAHHSHYILLTIGNKFYNDIASHTSSSKPEK